MAYDLKKIYLAITMLMMPVMAHLDGAYSEYQACEPICYPQECCSCNTWFLSADVLYWRAYENGLEDFCVPSEFIDTVGSDDRITSEIIQGDQHLHFNWDLGFRIGAGYNFASKGFDTAIYWTHFHEKAKGKHSHHHATRWKLYFDVIDLIAGHEFKPNSCFSFKPYAGLRGVWSDQKLHKHSVTKIISYQGTSFITSKTNDKERFWGLGPQIGVEADWNLRYGFSIYGSAAAALMYGRFDLKHHQIQVVSTATNFDFTKNHHCAVQGAIDAAIGIGWQRRFCKSLLLSFQLGLEHHRYWDFNQIGSSGDLCFDGVVFSTRVDF